MDFTELSNPEAVMAWFDDPCYDLCELGDTSTERLYLQAIDDVARRTGATNFRMADYIYRLENRLSKIESRLQ